MLRIAWATPLTSPHLWDLLEPAERARAMRFRHDADRARSVTGSALLRLVVGRWTGRPAAEVRLARHCRGCRQVTDHGRPVLRDADGSAPHLSLSHSADRVVVAACGRGPVGVDVERVGAATFEGFEDAVLDDAERAALAGVQPPLRPAWTTRAWTQKEALLKATGHGLTVSPARIRVDQGRILRWPDDLAGQLAPPVVPHVFAVDVGRGYLASAVVLSPLRPQVVVERADGWLSPGAAPGQGAWPGSVAEAG